MRVLVSGGEFEARQAVAKVARAAGAEVAEAAGTAEALRLMESATRRGAAFAVALDLDGTLAPRAAEVFAEGHAPVAEVRDVAGALDALAGAAVGERSGSGMSG